MRHIRLRTLTTNKEISSAVKQVVKYCPSLGCEYACITNGHEYVIFRAFVRGKDFLDTDAIVLTSLKYFRDSFTEAYNLLGYSSVVIDRSLQLALECLPIGPQQPVILPSFTFTATAAAVLRMGGRCIFTDIAELETPTLDPQNCCERIS